MRLKGYREIRILLLKIEISQLLRGLVFHPRADMLFFWPPLPSTPKPSLHTQLTGLYSYCQKVLHFTGPRFAIPDSLNLIVLHIPLPCLLFFISYLHPFLQSVLACSIPTLLTSTEKTMSISKAIWVF